MKRQREDMSDDLITGLLRTAAGCEPAPDRELLKRLREDSADAYERCCSRGRRPSINLSRAWTAKIARRWGLSAAAVGAALVIVSLLWPQGGGSTAFALSEMAAALQERPRVIVRRHNEAGETIGETWIDLPNKRFGGGSGSEFVRLYDLDSKTLKTYYPAEDVVRIWSLPLESTVARMLRGRSDVVDVLYEGWLSPLAKLKDEGVVVESHGSTLGGLPTRVLRAARTDEQGVEWLAIEIQLDARSAEPLSAKVTRKHALSTPDRSQYTLRFSYPSAEEMARLMPQIPATARVEDYRAADGLVKLLDLHAKRQLEWPRFRALVYKRASDRRWILWERVVRDESRWRYDDFRGQAESLNPGFQPAELLTGRPFGELWEQSLSFCLGNVELGNEQVYRRHVRGLQPLTKWQVLDPYPTHTAHTLCPIPGRRWPGEVRADVVLTNRVRTCPSDPKNPTWPCVEFEHVGESIKDPRDQYRVLRVWLDPDHGFVCRRTIGHVRVGRAPWRDNPEWTPDEPVKRVRPALAAGTMIYESDQFVEVPAVGRTPDGRFYPARFQRRHDMVYPDGERFLGNPEDYIIRVDIPDVFPGDAFEPPVDPPEAIDFPVDDEPA